MSLYVLPCGNKTFKTEIKVNIIDKSQQVEAAFHYFDSSYDSIDQVLTNQCLAFLKNSLTV